MRLRNIWHVVALIGIVCIVGVSGCSKPTNTAPMQVVAPAPGSSDFQYSVRFTYADSGYSVKRLEYADPYGVVRKVDYHAPLWVQTLSLKPGDRMYVRAEVAFASGLTGSIQVVGPPGFHASANVERLDGPASAVLVIDEIVK